MKPTKEDNNTLIENIDSGGIILLIQAFKGYDITSDVLGMVFEKIYVNEAGFNPVIMVDDFVNIHPAYRTKNRSTWNGSDVSYFGRRYNIVRGITSGRITSAKCEGP